MKTKPPSIYSNVTFGQIMKIALVLAEECTNGTMWRDLPDWQKDSFWKEAESKFWERQS